MTQELLFYGAVSRLCSGLLLVDTQLQIFKYGYLKLQVANSNIFHGLLFGMTQESTIIEYQENKYMQLSSIIYM